MSWDIYEKYEYDDLKLPAEWADWTITEKIDEGSYGKVYKAERNGECCAIKIIRIPANDAERRAILAENKDEDSITQVLKNEVDTYTNEITTMYLMQEDPHIVRIEDHYVEKVPDDIGYRIYIRMELLTSLEGYRADHEVTQELAVQIGMDICDALTTCDKYKVIHRDIKPENILVSDDGIFKLGDFGTARELDRTLGTYTMRGTGRYMAPEVAKRERYNKQVDIYSLGIVLYRMMNRERDPFMDLGKRAVYALDKEEALNRRLSGEALPAPVDASPALASVILKACAYKAEDRYPNAASMKEDLQKVLDPEAALQNRTGLQRKGLSARKRAEVIALLLAAGTAAGVAGNHFLTHRQLQKAVEAEQEGLVSRRAEEKNWSAEMEDALQEADILMTKLADYELTDAQSFIDCFTNADDETINGFFSDFRGFNEYPNRIIAPIAEIGGNYLLNVIGYDASYEEAEKDRRTGEENAVENEEEPETEEWMKGWTMILTKEEDDWKINLDYEIRYELYSMMWEGGFFPEGYMQAVEAGQNNTVMVDQYNYLYLDPEQTFDNLVTDQVAFFWQDEAGDLYACVQVSNGQEDAYAFNNMKIRIWDDQLGTIAEARLPGEIVVQPGTNEMKTWRIQADDVSTGLQDWSANGIYGEIISRVVLPTG